MSLTLPAPAPNYSVLDQAQMRRELIKEDKRNFKRGGDVEIENGRVILRSPDGSRFFLTVDNSGALGTTEIV